MKYENFLKVVMTQRKMEEQVSKAYEIKINLIDFVEDYHLITKTLLTEIYGEQGYDWYTWFCYENEYGEKDWNKSTTLVRQDDGTFVTLEQDEIVHGATDEHGNPICYSFLSLWEYLESDYNSKDKVV
jgi:hypothetical protein